MLACTAMLVGCTDDDVIESAEKQSQDEKMNAYVSLTINTATNSSRAETGGDIDGSSEHSGHENAGTTEENTVKNVMYILAKAKDAQGNNVSANDNDGIVKTGVTTIAPQTFQLQSIGTYDALVVINPEAGLLDAVNAATTPRAAYNAVLNYEYDDIVASNDAAMEDYTADGFMMANQTAVAIPVTKSNNSPETAASGVINVERAIAKITFRPTNNNVYSVTISKDVYEPITCYGWYISKKSEDVSVADTYSYDIFNSANNGQYWVRVKENLNPSDLGQVLDKNFNDIFDGIYTRGESDKEYEGYVNNVFTPGYVFTSAEELPTQIVLDKGNKKENGKTETYFVKLEKYALTNLSKKIYAVRHKIAASATDWSLQYTTPLGQLASTENLVDPNSNSKNNEEFAANWTGDTYFYNPLTAVTTEAEDLNTSTWDNATLSYFKDLNTLEDDETQAVTGGNTSGALDVTAGVHTGASEIGKFMSYCFENAVKQDKQVNGLVTGIVFAGQIYTDASCNPEYAVDVMYKYDSKFYREIRDLLNDPDIKDKTVFENISEYSTIEEVKQANISGLDVYDGGKCFYYANEIKHFDNNNNTERGIMEFAIMRNNIYSLKINTISEIGSSTVEPVVSDPAEDEGAYITMEAKILPWIVRFNDIEF